MASVKYPAENSLVINYSISIACEADTACWVDFRGSRPSV